LPVSRCVRAGWLLLTSVTLAAGAFALAPATAFAADAVSLSVGPNPVAYGQRVVLSGTVSPPAAGETVGIYAQEGDSSSFVASVATDAAGTFSVTTPVTIAETFVARGNDAAGNPVDSAPVSLRMRPRFATSLHGSRRIGEHLDVVGRVLPRDAGVVTVSDGRRRWSVHVGPAGRFRADLTTTRLYRYRAVIALVPAAGYVARHRTYAVRVEPLPLTIGSTGPAVAWLQHRLRLDHYALPGIDSSYGYATADAVLAFQEVHGLPRTGSVDVRFWQLLRSSAPPLPRIRSGNHIEVDKTRQVLFEVRDGNVVSVSHVSTGATGNTPPGHWHVYAKEAGYTPLGMYDSLFFTGAFAIHGYSSVPAYPASHGCVRTPLWFAGELYSRWDVGTSIYIFT
jgi:N-acetylmuramoyl-L-alanine amidase